MKVRTRLLWVWGFLAVIFWSLGDASRVALKYQVGGWRAAYVHLTLSVIFALIVSFVTMASGWLAVVVFRRIRTLLTLN